MRTIICINNISILKKNLSVGRDMKFLRHFFMLIWYAFYPDVPLISKSCINYFNLIVCTIYHNIYDITVTWRKTSKYKSVEWYINLFYVELFTWFFSLPNSTQYNRFRTYNSFTWDFYLEQMFLDYQVLKVIGLYFHTFCLLLFGFVHVLDLVYKAWCCLKTSNIYILKVLILQKWTKWKISEG